MIEPSWLTIAALGLAAVGCVCFGLGHLLATAKQRHLAQEALHGAQQQLLHQQQDQVHLRDELSRLRDELCHWRDESAALSQRNGELEKQNLLLDTHIQQLRERQQQLHHWQQRCEDSEQALRELDSRYQTAIAIHEQENRANADKLALVKQAEQHLQTQFENLADKIFQQKSQQFTQTNKLGLDALLLPLKEQIEGFKKQVTEQHIRDGQARASLQTEILNLRELNAKITQEAAALTKALKGDNKQQGNWGEVVLERILVASGLREGHEFETQMQLKNATGKAFKPDIIVHLPHSKDVVIDAKVSLSAYEQYVNYADDHRRQTALKEHIHSLRRHIKELGKKDYQQLHGIQSLDYVLMFVAVEPAYLLAIDQAPELVQQAIDANIMLVSPTNLMVALRTINNIWQYEYQNRNAQVIAAKAAGLYDKFHGLVSDMEKLGDSVDAVQKRYHEACKKLFAGRGNLVRRAEEFRTLGVQTSKKLDVERLTDND